MRPLGLAALSLGIALAGCGRYAELAQKLDVTARVVGDTWIAASPTDRTEIRVLMVGKPDDKGNAAFSFTAAQFPYAAGAWGTTLQGFWSEVGTSGATTLVLEHEYYMPDESGVGILNRRGSYRVDDTQVVALTVTQSAGRLVVTGDDRMTGTYVPLVQALGGIGGATERDATCAFELANLGLLSSDVRIIGFGGVGMTQYSQAETYVGTIAGSLVVSVSGFASNTTRIAYGGFVDLGGVTVDGTQLTYANSSGSGHMDGVLTFSLAPVAADGTAGAPLAGSIDYGGGGDSASAIQISNGNAVGGVYIVALAGGGSARVAPQLAASPSIAECLTLP